MVAGARTRVNCTAPVFRRRWKEGVQGGSTEKLPAHGRIRNAASVRDKINHPRWTTSPPQ